MFAEEPEWRSDADEVRLCESCREKPASVHVTRVEDEEIAQVFLCRECAEEAASEAEGPAIVLAMPPEFVENFAGVLDGEERGEEEEEEESSLEDFLSCGTCGTTLRDLKEMNLLGCASCYEVFGEYLAEPSEDEGGEVSLVFTGKIPAGGPEESRLRKEILRLRRMLDELVESERFEEAASVRDKLYELVEGRT